MKKIWNMLICRGDGEFTCTACGQPVGGHAQNCPYNIWTK